MNLTLVRYAYLQSATQGALTLDDGRRVWTIEEPWQPNPLGPGGTRLAIERVASCVPDGVYRLVPHSSAKHGEVWALVNPVLGVYHYPGEIPVGQLFGRSAVLIHAANTTKDIEGCIGPGLRANPLSPGVYESRAAVEILRKALGRTEHRLEIRPYAGTSEKL
jgi:hypothetical protein